MNFSRVAELGLGITSVGRVSRFIAVALRPALFNAVLVGPDGEEYPIAPAWRAY
jgi:hypothetical protein